ncbi:hypothetical protein PVAND_009987 [Polypedilum vanderplanki]|uniref:Uncharacterized protein n=1 Tax=Polypedilum vanderplanki TaxID=319348 RepID=A0A9J6CEY3_POLVA|nr:hypothetical protein PVAND_009987 [Polypedilum vanderplanki]
MAVNVLLQPKSRGSVNFNSCTDLYASIIINGNYLNETEDLETLLRGANFLYELFNTTSARNAGVKAFDIEIPEFVDSKLTVFGVKRTSSTPMLRVTNSSIMPFIPYCNTQCPDYAMGEKSCFNYY